MILSSLIPYHVDDLVSSRLARFIINNTEQRSLPLRNDGLPFTNQRCSMLCVFFHHIPRRKRRKTPRHTVVPWNDILDMQCRQLAQGERDGYATRCGDEYLGGSRRIEPSK
jgi:hypothetical protein